MDRHFRSTPIGWLCAGLLVLGAGVAALAQLQSGVPSGFDSFPVGKDFKAVKPAEQPQALTEVEALKKATVNGKYSKLLTVIRVPADQGSYGNFSDYGLFTGTTWAGYTGLPQGYWVYVYPHWFIWEQQGGQAAPGQGQVINENVPAKASVNDKYSQLLKVINVPGDQATYGDFNDYGYWSGNSWAGFDMLPPGYWVYVAPKWYIWGNGGKQQAPPQQQANPAPADQVKASVDGKYIKLLKVISVPADKNGYGEFNDYGFYEGKEYAGFQNLPQGFWVYVAPHWFIWGELANPPVAPPQQAPAGPAEVKATVNGKYSQLLRVINVPQDQTDYGAFSDYGYYSGNEWAGYDNLPPGYWVYVMPNWYIWAKQNGQAAPKFKGGLLEFPAPPALVPAPPAPIPVPQIVNPDQAKAAVNGKYSKLLAVINVPQDVATYGAFNDYGYWTGTDYVGFQNLPQGYWVYVAPNWYIWGQQAGAAPPLNPAPLPVPVAPPVNPNPAPIPGDQGLTKASVNGKYVNLLKVIDVPQDEAAYGKFSDYGFYTGTSWAGFNNLPQGYWVYVAPKWYIWGSERQRPNVPVAPVPNPGVNPVPPVPIPVPGGADQVKASVNGKYSKLLRVINVPQDQGSYGQFNDYGHYTGTSWAGFDNLPPGYWVYVFPNWYIWGEEKK